MNKVIMPKIRLGENEKQEYLKEKLGTNNVNLIAHNSVQNIQPLIQNDYGGDQDCTLTSITCVLHYLTKLDDHDIYDKVETIAKRYLYDPNTSGTFPLFIKPIMEKSAKELGYTYESKVKYGNNLFFNYNTLIDNIDKGIPTLLSIMNDGRDCYKNHTVLIIGYQEYENINGKVRFLQVYDNWYSSISYVDYDLLNIISSINYYII